MKPRKWWAFPQCEEAGDGNGHVWRQLGSWEPQAPSSILLKVFSDVGAIQSLKRLVSYSTNGTTSALAKRALRLLGEEVPRRILPCVASWKEAEVQTWLQQIGFSNYCENFRVEPRAATSSYTERAHPRGA